MVTRAMVEPTLLAISCKFRLLLNWLVRAQLRGLIESVLVRDAFAVRGLLFDKLPQANWGLPWHQDLSIAVRERRETPGFGPWSVKDGVTHVQPPEAIMAGMLAVRVHLDDADRSNGALRVIGGSHTNGRLSAGAIATFVASGKAVSIDAPAGSAASYARFCYTPRRQPNPPHTAA